VSKTSIVFYELLNQLFHIDNVVIWPKLEWQAAEGLNRELWPTSIFIPTVESGRYSHKPLPVEWNSRMCLFVFPAPDPNKLHGDLAMPQPDSDFDLTEAASNRAPCA
jgi:hypothetical protein